MDALAGWFLSHQPVESMPPPCNDYKYDNLVLNPEHLHEITGVLDWEMATVGDPWMDWVYLLAYWAESRDGELAKVFNISRCPETSHDRRWLTGTRKVEATHIGDCLLLCLRTFQERSDSPTDLCPLETGALQGSRFGTLIHVIKDLTQDGCSGC